MIIIHHSDSLLSLLENGYISSSGDTARDGYVRTEGYLQLTGKPKNVTVSFNSTNTLLVNFVGYQNQSPSPIVCDLYWYESPKNFDISSYSNLNYYRLLFKRKDGGSSLDYTDISECTIEYDEEYTWYIDSNGNICNDDLKPMASKPIDIPFPKGYWRISPEYNYGYPYHELLNDISYIPRYVVPTYKSPVVYRIVANGKEIYASNNIDKRYGIIDPVVTLEDSSTNSLQFKIPPDHYFYNKIERLKTKCRVLRNGKEIFEGRVVSETLDFYNRRDVLFEGALAYLNDTHQPQREYSYYTVVQIIESILDIHNSKVDNSRKIYKGVVSITEPYPRKDYYWYTQYESTLTAIQKLAEATDAHIRVRKDENDGLRKLDIFQEMTEVSKQKIIFGSNLSDFTRTYDMGDLVTVLLPLGKHTSDNDDIGNLLEARGEDEAATPAWDKWHYETHERHVGYWGDYSYGGPSDTSSLKYYMSLYVNTDEEDTSDYNNKGERVNVYYQNDYGPSYYRQYVYWIDVNPGDVFYLTSSLHNETSHECYHYTIWDSNGFQLSSKSAGSHSSGGPSITTITKEKIECPTGARYMLVSGIIGEESYPFELYESRKLPEEMDSYITIEECAEVVGEHEAGSLYIKAQPRVITTIDQNGVAHSETIDPYTEWGYIEKTIEFEDIEDKDDLYSKAKEYLENYQYDQMKMELNAIDAKVLGVDTDDIFLYQNIRCISPKHALDHLFPVTKLTLNLSNPTNNKISLNSSNERSFTQNSSSINDELFNKIAKAGEKSQTIEAAKKNAFDLINNSNTGIVSLNTDPNTGYVTSITISCDDKWRSNGNYWIWNQGGLMYVRPDGTSASVAITNDGHIVADVVAAGTAINGATLTNTLTVGAVDHTPGDIKVVAPVNSNPNSGVWDAIHIFSGTDSVDGPYGEIASYTKPNLITETGKYLQYYTKILNGKEIFGYQYANSDGTVDSDHKKLTISTIAWGNEERATIDASDGNLDIHSSHEIALWSNSLYFKTDGSVYVKSGTDPDTGADIYNTAIGNQTLTIGSTTYKVVNGLLCESS